MIIMFMSMIVMMWMSLAAPVIARRPRVVPLKGWLLPLSRASSAVARRPRVARLKIRVADLDLNYS